MTAKKGQAALEFLTTYGWALLVVLVMIGAITYFGILNPTKFVPARCTTSPELACTDYKIDSSTNKVQLIMKQSVGKTIQFQNITCEFNGARNTAAGSTPAVNTAWNPKASQGVNCTLPANTFSGLKGQKVKVNYEIYYLQSAGGLMHTASGEVFAEVQ